MWVRACVVWYVRDAVRCGAVCVYFRDDINDNCSDSNGSVSFEFGPNFNIKSVLNLPRPD